MLYAVLHHVPYVGGNRTIPAPPLSSPLFSRLKHHKIKFTNMYGVMTAPGANQDRLEPASPLRQIASLVDKSHHHYYVKNQYHKIKFTNMYGVTTATGANQDRLEPASPLRQIPSLVDKSQHYVKINIANSNLPTYTTSQALI
jgi:hypothetical protein